MRDFRSRLGKQHLWLFRLRGWIFFGGIVCLLSACEPDRSLRLLERIPEPDLSQAESGVRAALKGARLRAREALQKSRNARERAEAFGELGLNYHANGQLELAAEAYALALRLAPRELRWQALSGLLALEQNRPEAAVPFWQKATELAPGNGYAWARLAMSLYGAGRASESAAAAERALKLLPQEPLALLAAARAFEATEAWERAGALYAKLLDLQPQAVHLFSSLAHVRRRLGDREGATEVAKRYGRGVLSVEDPWLREVESRAVGSERWAHRGDQLLRAGRPFEAAQAFEKALQADPNRGEVRLALALALARSGQGAQALEAAEQARARLPPEDPRPLLIRAGLLEALGKPTEAFETLEAALALAPEDKSVLEAFARFALARGFPEKALPAAERLTKLLPTESEGHLLLAAASWNQGKKEAALQALARARRSRETPDRVLEAAWIRTASLLPERSVSLGELERTANRVFGTEEDPLAHEARAYLLLRRKRFSEGARLLHKALAQLPEKPDPLLRSRLLRAFEEVQEGKPPTQPLP